MQGNGVAGVNANAKAEGLSIPAIGYWSAEGYCFVVPSTGTCNGILNIKGF